jgi:hypothetical protein
VKPAANSSARSGSLRPGLARAAGIELCLRRSEKNIHEINTAVAIPRENCLSRANEKDPLARVIRRTYGRDMGVSECARGAMV